MHPLWGKVRITIRVMVSDMICIGFSTRVKVRFRDTVRLRLQLSMRYMFIVRVRIINVEFYLSHIVSQHWRTEPQFLSTLPEWGGTRNVTDISVTRWFSALDLCHIIDVLLRSTQTHCLNILTNCESSLLQCQRRHKCGLNLCSASSTDAQQHSMPYHYNNTLPHLHINLKICHGTCNMFPDLHILTQYSCRVTVLKPESQHSTVMSQHILPMSDIPTQCFIVLAWSQH